MSLPLHPLLGGGHPFEWRVLNNLTGHFISGVSVREAYTSSSEGSIFDRKV